MFKYLLAMAALIAMAPAQGHWQGRHHYVQPRPAYGYYVPQARYRDEIRLVQVCYQYRPHGRLHCHVEERVVPVYVGRW
jgi:hypothetical protein